MDTLNSKPPHSRDWIIDTEATTQSVGSKHKECTKCHTVLETEEIPVVELSGLFDANRNCLSDWNTLITKYGLDISKDYSSYTYNETVCKTMKNNPQLSTATKLIILKSCERIGKYAFTRCTLKSVELGGVKTIAPSSFGESSITNVDFKNSIVETIGESAFGGSSITTAEFPDTLKSIDIAAFSDCLSLNYIYISSSVTTMCGSNPLYSSGVFLELTQEIFIVVQKVNHMVWKRIGIKEVVVAHCMRNGVLLVNILKNIYYNFKYL